MTATPDDVGDLLEVWATHDAPPEGVTCIRVVSILGCRWVAAEIAPRRWLLCDDTGRSLPVLDGTVAAAWALLWQLFERDRTKGE